MVKREKKLRWYTFPFSSLFGSKLLVARAAAAAPRFTSPVYWHFLLDSVHCKIDRGKLSGSSVALAENRTLCLCLPRKTLEN